MNRLSSLLVSGLLSVGLLSAEYWLMINDERAELIDRQHYWGELSAELLRVRMQAMLDHSAVLAQSLANSPQPRSLAVLARSTIRDDTPFGGLGIIEYVRPEQREAFESRIANSIRVLQDRHLAPSPRRPLYYPVSGYLPDDSNALPQGLDLGGVGNARRKMDLARHSTQPVLMPTTLPGSNGSRLDIVVRLNDDNTLLLLNLRKDKLIQDSQREPGTASPLRHVRIVAWTQEQPDAPLLDSQPTRPLPSTPPLYTIRHNLGGNEILFGAYPQGVANPGMRLNHWAILATTAGFLLAMFWFQQQQAQSRRRMQDQLKRSQQQLEMNTRTLREQINDRVMSEQALAQSEARQRAILQASSDAIILIDHQGLVLQINPAAVRLIGQSADMVRQLPIGKLLDELYDRNPARSFEHIAQEHEGRPFEASLRRSDEHMLPVELSLSRVTLPDDWFYVVVCRDISIRKEQEAALIELKNSLAEQVEVQSRQLSALLDASPMAMAYIVDRNLLQVNRAFLDLFEQREEVVLGHSTLPFFESPEQWERTGKALYSLLNDGKVVQTEQRLRTGTGKLFWCRLYGKAINPSVPKLGTIWLYQDFSAQRALEETLRHAKVLAEENSRAKTEFLANMSHELRTPLHAILGFTEMGQARSRGQHDDKMAQYFSRIQSSGNRLLTLLNDLLDLAKMEVGRMEYTISRNNLCQCLHDICDEMTPLAALNDIRIYLNCSSEQLHADIDPFRIGQVMRNLLSNAIKFSPHGGEIYVNAGLRQDADGENILVTVEDTGPGVPESELESIFDKFIQSSSTKTGAGGTGLGLAICREIISAHHGRIFASNLPTRGALFTFIIPRTGQAGATEDPNHAPQTTAR